MTCTLRANFAPQRAMAELVLPQLGRNSRGRCDAQWFALLAAPWVALADVRATSIRVNVRLGMVVHT